MIPEEVKLKILVVDDDPDMRKLLKKFLEATGKYKVLTAREGGMGKWLAECRWHKPNLILLDLILPGIDGMEVLRKLREEKSTQFVPIIIITGRTDSAFHVQAEGLYCDDYIVKPINLQTLKERIEAVFKKRGII